MHDFGNPNCGARHLEYWILFDLDTTHIFILSTSEACSTSSLMLARVAADLLPMHMRGRGNWDLKIGPNFIVLVYEEALWLIIVCNAGAGCLESPFCAGLFFLRRVGAFSGE